MEFAGLQFEKVKWLQIIKDVPEEELRTIALKTCEAYFEMRIMIQRMYYNSLNEPSKISISDVIE